MSRDPRNHTYSVDFRMLILGQPKTFTVKYFTVHDAVDKCNYMASPEVSGDGYMLMSAEVSIDGLPILALEHETHDSEDSRDLRWVAIGDDPLAQLYSHTERVYPPIDDFRSSEEMYVYECK